MKVLLATGALFLAIQAAPIMAQGLASQQIIASGYDALIASLNRPEHTERSVISAGKAFADYVADNVEGFGVLEAQKPNLRSEVAEAVLPALRTITDRNRPPMLQEMRAVIVAKLSAEEASTMAAFFNSPTGVKFLNGYVSNPNIRHAVQDVEKGGDITPEGYNKDQIASVNSAMRAMNAEDLAVLTAAGQDPAFLKFGELSGPITAIRVKYENAVSPADVAALEAAMTRVIETNFPDTK